MGIVTSNRCEIFCHLQERGDTADAFLFLYCTHTASVQRVRLKDNITSGLLGKPEHNFTKLIKKQKQVTVRDGEGKRPSLMSMFSGCVKGDRKKTADRDGSHLWSLVINWPWSLLCPVRSSWCRRWKGSAIYQHLRVNLSRPQRLGAAEAGADYHGSTPTAHIFISNATYSHC